MAFITDEQLRDALADRLKVAGNDVPAAFSSTIVNRSNTAAYQDVVGRLIARGYTKAQIDQWDRGAEFQTMIGLYWCVVNAGAYGGFDPETLKAWDRRKELAEVIVAINGAWVRPTGDQPGLVVTSGPSTSGSLFNLDPDDGRVGEVTRF